MWGSLPQPCPAVDSGDWFWNNRSSIQSSVTVIKNAFMDTPKEYHTKWSQRKAIIMYQLYVESKK